MTFEKQLQWVDRRMKALNLAMAITYGKLAAEWKKLAWEQEKKGNLSIASTAYEIAADTSEQKQAAIREYRKLYYSLHGNC